MPAEWVALEAKTKFFRLPDNSNYNSLQELKARLNKATVVYKDELEKALVNQFGEKFKLKKSYNDYVIMGKDVFDGIDLEILQNFTWNYLLTLNCMDEDYYGFMGLIIPKEEFNPDDVTHFRLSTEQEKYVKVYPNIKVNSIKFTPEYHCKFKLDIEYNRILDVTGVSSTLPTILRIQKVNDTAVKRLEKALNVMNCILEAYKEPYIKWKNNIIAYQKLEESLDKKFKILVE